jgi:hypothetical protein
LMTYYSHESRQKAHGITLVFFSVLLSSNMYTFDDPRRRFSWISSQTVRCQW